jgi:hypothetical protein
MNEFEWSLLCCSFYYISYWCRSLTTGSNKVLKASLPLRNDRVKEARRVKQSVMKRPSSQHKYKSADASPKRKRTAFTRLRKGMLIAQGSKALYS